MTTSAEHEREVQKSAQTAPEVARTAFELRALTMTERHFAHHTALEGKDMSAHALIEGGDGNLNLLSVGALFTSDDGKDMAASVIRRTSAVLQATAIAFVTEAWVVWLDKDKLDLDRMGRVSERSDRREAVIVHVEEFACEPVAFHSTVVRAGKRSLSGWVRMDKEVSGRFTDMLRARAETV